jgi:hypothetical protein
MSIRPALTRPMDLSYRSNVFIVIATPTIGAVVGVIALIRSEPLVESFWWGYFGAGAAFLAWAITREIHPDRAWLATVAALIAPLGLLWGRSDLLASAVVLLVARTVAGTTGRSLRLADLVLLGVVAAPVIVRDSGCAVLAVSATALAFTLGWHERRRIVHGAATALFAVAAVVSLVVRDGPLVVSTDASVLLWVGAVAGVISLVGPAAVSVGTDRADGTISRLRVRVARGVVLAAGIGVGITHDPAAMAPAWAALVATAVRPR